VFRRTLLESPDLSQQLQLTHPRWALALSWAAFGTAQSALVLGVSGWDIPIWVIVLGVALSARTYGVVQRRQQTWLRTHYLYFDERWGVSATTPHLFWGTFSQNSSQTAMTSVIFQQHWSHFFGLSLRLNLHNHPHNKPEVVTLTLWRSQLPAQTYRRLNVWAAWQAGHGMPLSTGETA